MIPVQITLRNITASAALETHIRQKVEKITAIL